MVTIEHLGFQYSSGSDLALRDVNLEIRAGDFVGIIGNSGAGKTTLTCALNGIIPHHYKGDFYGSVRIDGLDTVETRLEDLSRIVGSVFQDIDGQMVASMVEDEILFGLENFGVPKEEIEERMLGAMETVGISHLRYRSIQTLSGGQKQKVAIAAIVALRPRLLVLDEPTGELDPVSSRQIFTMLRELNETYGMTIVIVEQKIMLLCEFAHKLLVMNEGQVVYYDSTRKVLEHSQELERIGMNVPRVVTLANELKKRDLYHGAAPLDVEEALQMVRGCCGNVLSKLSEETKPNEGSQPNDVRMTSDAMSVGHVREVSDDIVIDFENVSFSYDQEQLIQDVSFQVEAGAFVAMIGANGAGKSTLSKLMNGLHKPANGRVLVKGQDTKTTKTSQLVRHIGYLFQNPDRQICQNTIADEILFGLTYTVSEEAERQDRLQRTLSYFHLDGSRDPFHISRGERQKVALASIVACEPEILILDEPTTGLDYQECMEIMDIICQLNQKGTTIFMITHDMEIAQDFADRIMLFSHGRLLAYDETRRVMRDHTLLEQASVLPAQITQLAGRLGTAFDGVYTVEEMADRLSKLVTDESRREKGGEQ